MKPLVVPVGSDITGDLAKIFSNNLSCRTRISGKTERGKSWYTGSFPLGGNDTSRKVLTLSVRGFTRLLVLQGDKHQRPFRVAITSAKRCHCFKALAAVIYPLFSILIKIKVVFANFTNVKIGLIIFRCASFSNFHRFLLSFSAYFIHAINIKITSSLNSLVLIRLENLFFAKIATRI